MSWVLLFARKGNRGYIFEDTALSPDLRFDKERAIVFYDVINQGSLVLRDLLFY